MVLVSYLTMFMPSHRVLKQNWFKCGEMLSKFIILNCSVQIADTTLICFKNRIYTCKNAQNNIYPDSGARFYGGSRADLMYFIGELRRSAVSWWLRCFPAPRVSEARPLKWRSWAGWKPSGVKYPSRIFFTGSSHYSPCSIYEKIDVPLV